MVKNLFSILLILTFFGCASRTKNKTSTQDGKTSKSAVKNNIDLREEFKKDLGITNDVEAPSDVSAISETPQVSEPVVKVPPVSVKSIPRIGIIFSGGGAKAWAHIGFLKEIEKAKWPVHSVAGFEWGAAVAAIYASNFSSNEVEWELSKVRDFDDVVEISNSIFSKKSVNDLKIPFVCPSFNIAKQTLYLLNRGLLNKLIPFCLPMPPLSHPFSYSVAAMYDVQALAQHLRSTGANKIVLINVLALKEKRTLAGDLLSTENIVWSQSAALMSAGKIKGVDDIISLELDGISIRDLDRRRDIIAKGAELSYEYIKRMSQKYGL